jgi:hypothetical protein
MVPWCWNYVLSQDDACKKNTPASIIWYDTLPESKSWSSCDGEIQHHKKYLLIKNVNLLWPWFLSILPSMSTWFSGDIRTRLSDYPGGQVGMSFSHVFKQPPATCPGALECTRQTTRSFLNIRNFTDLPTKYAQNCMQASGVCCFEFLCMGAVMHLPWILICVVLL